MSILTSQLLCAPSIWARPDGLRTTLRVLRIFSNAATEISRQAEKQTALSTRLSTARTISREDWVISVLKGADSSSPRWQHLCAFAGILIGFEGKHSGELQPRIRSSIEKAIVKSTNTILQQQHGQDRWPSNSVILILGHVFHLIRHGPQNHLDFSLIQQHLCYATLFSAEGFNSGFFLGSINTDIIQVAHSQFCWLETSPSYLQLVDTSNAPMLAGLGSISLLGAQAIHLTQNWEVICAALKDISAFARSLSVQWQQNKICEIDVTEEGQYLTVSTLQKTLPLLWRTLRSAIFHIVILLESIMRRAIDGLANQDSRALFLAREIIQILHDTAFITLRANSTGFSQYRFIFLGAIDIFAQHPDEATYLLQGLSESRQRLIPQHPMDRYSDLYFLNLAENLAPVLSTEASETLLIGAASPYLASGGDPRLSEMFEAAHSVMLAVLSLPRNGPLLQQHIQAYLDALFHVFPKALSARQYRMAIKTIIFATSSSSAFQDNRDLSPSTVLEIVKWQFDHPSAFDLQLLPQASKDGFIHPVMTPHSIYLLSIIDSLPVLPTQDLAKWLPIIAESFGHLPDPAQMRLCVERLWEVLSNGDMDMNRTAFCVSWWTSFQGRQSFSTAIEEETTS